MPPLPACVCPNDPETCQAVSCPGSVVSAQKPSQSTICLHRYLANETRTSTFSSGNPPSTFLSQTRTGCASLSTVSQTRNRPAVSSAFSGMVVTLLIAGDGKVKNNSVATHWALCSLRQLHIEHFKMLVLSLGASDAYQRHCKRNKRKIQTFFMFTITRHGRTLSQNSIVIAGALGPGGTNVVGSIGS